MFEDLPDWDEPKSEEVIRIGTAGSRILSVTQQKIDYIGITGERRTLDLQECARNYVRWHSEHSDEFVVVGDPADAGAWNARCVGTRGALDDPPWVQFMNERNTRFEFDNEDALYQQLLNPIARHGWHTFDTD